MVVVVVMMIMIVMMVMIVVIMVMMIVTVIVMMRVIMVLTIVVLMIMGLVIVPFMLVRHDPVVLALGVILKRLRRLGIGRGALDHLAPDAVAMAATAGIAVARRAAAMAAVLVLFLGLAMGAFVGLDQRLTVGDRDLVVVGMDFAEGQEAVAVAAIFDEGGLQRRLDARHLGEINVAAQLFALGGLEIKFFDAIAADHDDPGLFRVGGIDQHLVWHFGALDGGGRGVGRARAARPGDATVHLIRG
ncbi:hypothetical protein [Bradyrhizobium jicamae]|uniref:hypothetical protein n=1 Tax=Bradyrhizobium jicamae TaxID=280332 RepID=UPI0032DFFC27